MIISAENAFTLKMVLSLIKKKKLNITFAKRNKTVGAKKKHVYM